MLELLWVFSALLLLGVPPSLLLLNATLDDDVVRLLELGGLLLELLSLLLLLGAIELLDWRLLLLGAIELLLGGLLLELWVTKLTQLGFVPASTFCQPLFS